MNQKGRSFGTVLDIERESQGVLDSIKENTSTVLVKRENPDGIAEYVLKETILKEMAVILE
jgi:hypothetical protein